MELGRKFIFSVLAIACVMGIAIFAMLTKQPVPDSVVAAVTTMCLAYTGTNVAATYAHATSANSTTNRSVSEATTRQIIERRNADDGIEPA